MGRCRWNGAVPPHWRFQTAAVTGHAGVGFLWFSVFTGWWRVRRGAGYTVPPGRGWCCSPFLTFRVFPAIPTIISLRDNVTFPLGNLCIKQMHLLLKSVNCYSLDKIQSGMRQHLLICSQEGKNYLWFWSGFIWEELCCSSKSQVAEASLSMGWCPCGRLEAALCCHERPNTLFELRSLHWEHWAHLQKRVNAWPPCSSADDVGLGTLLDSGYLPTPATPGLSPQSTLPKAAAAHSRVCEAELPNRWLQAWAQQGETAPSRLSSACHTCTNVVTASKCFACPFLYCWKACVNAQAVPKQLMCSKIFKIKWCALSTQCFSFKIFFA